MNTLAKRIKKLRKNKDLSREDLSKVLNLSYWAIAKYETGDRVPDSKTLKKIADYFDVSIDYLLGRTDNRHSFSSQPQEIEKTDLDEEWPEVTSILRRSGKKLTPEDKRRIARIIKAAIPAEDEDE